MSTVFHNILRAADKRYARRFAVLGAVFLAVLLGSLLVGRYALSPGQLVQMLWTRITGGAADWPISDDKVVFAVRLPRVAAAALVGAALAVSGAAAGSADTVTARLARGAVGVLPVVGSILADAADTVLAGVSTRRCSTTGSK